jgi:hypothetical protein
MNLSIAATLAQLALPPSITLEPGTTNCAAIIAVYNGFGLLNSDITIHTPHGPVVLRYTTTIASQPGDTTSADRAQIMDLPEGLAAVPMELEILETQTGRICLVRYIGG